VDVLVQSRSARHSFFPISCRAFESGRVGGKEEKGKKKVPANPAVRRTERLFLYVYALPGKKKRGGERGCAVSRTYFRGRWSFGATVVFCANLILFSSSIREGEGEGGGRREKKRKKNPSKVWYRLTRGFPARIFSSKGFSRKGLVTRAIRRSRGEEEGGKKKGNAGPVHSSRLAWL